MKKFTLIHMVKVGNVNNFYMPQLLHVDVPDGWDIQDYIDQLQLDVQMIMVGHQEDVLEEIYLQEGE